ncbi:hypothetical protein SH591_16130 [Sphingomonas sp. LY54]|uniref:hypothetical protein n=1 Tax=Sphingomonas sp. LY54 TaxID=3095343 RepID=UPI002D795871|nr:hypothetical protein [Sphingomonas sp. LY54]WRP28588.1 hypothetical protein SH591_16130 [Sphingomonas sp. LY54]
MKTILFPSGEMSIEATLVRAPNLFAASLAPSVAAAGAATIAAPIRSHFLIMISIPPFFPR